MERRFPWLLWGANFCLYALLLAGIGWQGWRLLSRETAVQTAGPPPAVVAPPAPELPPRPAPRPRPIPPVPARPAPAPQPEPGPVPSQPETLPQDEEKLPEFLDKQLRCTGAFVLDPAYRIPTTRADFACRAWAVRLQLTNATPYPVELGEDLLFFERTVPDVDYRGYAVFLGREPRVTSPQTYGLTASHLCRQVDGSMRRTLFANDSLVVTPHVAAMPDQFGVVPPGKNWVWEQPFFQADILPGDGEPELLLVLPELRVPFKSRVQRFRLLVTCRADPAQGNTWRVVQQTLQPIDPDKLSALLRREDTSLTEAVLALNWLAERDVREALAFLRDTAVKLEDGRLAIVCLELLRALKADGVEGHALALLQNEARDKQLRAAAARYLGTLGHERAKETLQTITRHGEGVVALGAYYGLAQFGGIGARHQLLSMLRNRDRDRGLYHAQIAAALADADLKELKEMSGDLFEELLGSKNPLVIAGLAQALFRCEWRDEGKTKVLGQRLKDATGDERYDYLRLLRQVSGTDAGPRDRAAYEREPERWVQYWLAWAAQR